MIDLSKAAGLKGVVLRATPINFGWVTTALRTITTKHQEFRRISIHVYLGYAFNGTTSANVRRTIGEQKFGQWSELDHVLAKLWESHSIRPGILYYLPPSEGTQAMTECIGCLLPEITRRGIIDLARWEP